MNVNCKNCRIHKRYQIIKVDGNRTCPECGRVVKNYPTPPAEKYPYTIKGGLYDGYSVVWIDGGGVFPTTGYFLQKIDGDEVTDTIKLEDAFNQCYRRGVLNMSQDLEDSLSNIQTENLDLYEDKIKDVCQHHV